MITVIRNAMLVSMVCSIGAIAAAASIASRPSSAMDTNQNTKILRTDLATGKQIYDQKCAACHFSASTEKKIGPGLAKLMKRRKFQNGMTADDEHLRRVIERGGKDMPGFLDSLKEKQIRDLIAYVQTL